MSSMDLFTYISLSSNEREKKVENIWKYNIQLCFPPDIAYSAIDILDRILEKCPESYLGILEYFCLWFSLKYQKDEVLPIIQPKKFTTFLKKKDREDIVGQLYKLEMKYFELMDYQVPQSTLPSFLNHYAFELQVKNKLKSLAEYICTVSTLHPDYRKYSPSLIAMTSLKISSQYNSFVLGYKEIYQRSGHKPGEIKQCTNYLNILLKEIQVEHCLFHSNRLAGYTKVNP